MKYRLNMFNYLFLLLISLNLLAAGRVSPVVDFQSARTLGLAGAGKADPTLTDVIMLNPSALGFREIQALSGTYDWLNHKDPAIASTEQRVLNGSVVDGRNQYVSAGFAFTRRPDLDMFHLVLAKKLTENFAVGGTAKRFNTRPAYQTIAGDVTGYDGGLSATFNSASLIPIPIQVGVTLDNLVRDSADEKFIGGRKLGVGARANLSDILFVMTDYTRNMGNNYDSFSSLNLATELQLGGGLVARAGLQRMYRQGWGVGGSWMAPRIGFNYGYNKRTGPEDGYEHALTVDLYM